MALRNPCNDSKSTSEELLNKDNSVSIHHRNFQVLAIQMFKIKNTMAPAFSIKFFRTAHYEQFKDKLKFL